MTNVEALKNLYAALGGNAADVADAVTNVDVLNAIAGFLGGEGNATSISEAIENIVPVAPTGDGEELDALINRSIREVKSDVLAIGTSAFKNCTALEIADFTTAREIWGGAFENCTSLHAVIFRRNERATFGIDGTAENAFKSTPIASGTGYIYVPDDLVDSYKAATNWSTYANQIKGISELPTE